MNNLEQKTITSMEVASMIEKDHSKLIRDIRRYLEQLAEAKIGSGDFFSESTYLDTNNQTRPCFDVTKKGCEFIAHKLTGVKGTEFTAKYINRFHDMEEQIQKPLTQQEMMRIQLGMIDDHENRLENLENHMTIDYGQQLSLGDAVNVAVLDALGGKESLAYREIGKKVFSECNRDLKHFFGVNARNNVPKLKYEEAVEYARNWKPCTNTTMLIRQYNSQVTLV